MNLGAYSRVAFVYRWLRGAVGAGIEVPWGKKVVASHGSRDDLLSPVLQALLMAAWGQVTPTQGGLDSLKSTES